MISTPAISALRAAEKNALVQQWRQGERYIRCFHASTGRKSDKVADPTGEKESPIISPKRESRQQRAAKVSEEVSNLSKSSKPATPQATQPTASKGKDVPLQDGSASDPERSPLVAGVEKGLKKEATAKSKTKEAGGAKQENTHMSFTRLNRERLPLSGEVYHIPIVSRRRLIRTGSGSSTLAGSNFKGVLSEYIKRTQRQRGLKKAGALKTKGKEGMKMAVDKHIIGKIDSRLTPSASTPTNPTANGVLKMVLKNSTYFTLDIERIVNKVDSLVPVASKEDALKRQQERRAKLQAQANKK